ncbi:MAG: SAM-dependent methyltransferase [Herminiimonas sp.]|nr:SAM-dependent methyltransferase [Herminiimonas sp.]
MQANSRAITSRQTTVHEHLRTRVERHAANLFRKPITDYNRDAFGLAMHAWQQAGSLPLILDAGCGVALSTHHLALQFPDHFVLGVDQSADRLSRGREWPAPTPPNLLLVRADLVDFWRLLHADGVRLARHYILYPNPWPKIGHLARRWHAHPVFPVVIGLGGWFECRSNWPIYIDECAAALTQLQARTVVTESFMPTNPITPFERKYLASGHGLSRCLVLLGGVPDASRPDVETSFEKI